MRGRTILVLALLLVLSNFGYSQTHCNCEQALNLTIKKVEGEYPGFEQKTKDKLAYNNYKNNLLAEAKTTQDASCVELLTKYTSYFKDRHLWVVANATVAPQQKEAIPAKKMANINLKKFYANLQKTKDKLEGVWRDDKYKIGLTKTGENEYVGFIIEADPNYWKPGEIKFKLFANGNYEYYMQDHSIQKGTFKSYDNCLLYFNVLRSSFVKENPTPALNATQIADRINEVEGFYVKQLTPKTAVIKLSSFDYPYVDRIEKLIAANRSTLESSENLIIDIRGNGGGTDNAYQTLLPYLVTNPTRHMGAEFLASQSFIDGLERYRAGIKDDVKKKEEVEGIDRKISLLRQNLGKYVRFSADSVTIDTIAKAQKSPKQIVVLTDGRVASSGENLTLVAKQSKKVKTMGTPTSGVLDYANGYLFEIGCGNYRLVVPTYRSFRLPNYPIDNIGIQPDIYLDQSVKDWVAYAIDYLEN